MMYFLTYRDNGEGVHTAIYNNEALAVRCASIWCASLHLSAEIIDDKGKPLMRVWRSLEGVQTQYMY